jgi:hypothetical protein
MSSIIIPRKEFRFETNGFRFNNNETIQHPGTPAVTDGHRWSGSFWFRRLGNFGTTQQILFTGSSSLLVSLRTTNRLRIQARNPSNTQILVFDSETIIVDENLHHVLFSLDLQDSSKKHYYIDGKNELGPSAHIFTNDIINFTRADLSIGSALGFDTFNGELAEIWFFYNQYIDFSSKGNRDKFSTANNEPVFLGENGERPLNKVPTMYFSGHNGGSITRNRGSIGFGKSDDWTLTGNPIRTPMPLGKMPFKPLIVIDLPSAAQDQNIEGSLFEDADTFNNGLITVDIEGSVLTDGDIFNSGLVTSGILGSILEDADTINEGDLDLQLFGSLLEDPDLFNNGLITVDIEGSVLTDGDTLNEGDVSPQQVFGSILTDADTINEGTVLAGISGSLLTDADTFFQGDVSPQQVFGSILQDADTLNEGDVDLIIHGSLLEDADIINQGDLNLQMFGSLFEDTDTLFEGDVFVLLQQIDGSTLEDGDTFFQGGVSNNLFGSLLQDADIFNNSLITHLIAGSFLSDPDDINHGELNFSIAGSLFVDPDSINQGEMSSLLDIKGSLLSDEDIFNDGNIDPQTMVGSLLFDPDTLFDGLISNNNIGGSLFEDIDIINSGILGKADIEGSLLQDPDRFFGGDIPIQSIYRILITGEIIGGDIVDLSDEVVFASARGVLIGKHGVKTETSNV